jgi:hypothetical protein
MKTKFILALALAGSALVPESAHARRNHDAAIAIGIGSFIGGVIVGTHINQDRHHPAPVVYCPPEPQVVVVNTPSCPPPPCPPPPPSGYWQTVQTRVFVPARWIYTTDDCGRRTRVYQLGYYTYQSERVWVSTVETVEVCRDDRAFSRRDRRDDWRH